ncbi:hypothetical protein FWG76_00100 [Candidatus Saccharibacteria bacterium]|nr:hypothetical protein [Candidatus Saccharibacteria bacterium]
MNNNRALIEGGLVGKAQFFGTATAEIISSNNTGIDLLASWNLDVAQSVFDTQPWFRRSERSFSNTSSGVFAFYSQAGAEAQWISHRTILLGY